MMTVKRKQRNKQKKKCLIKPRLMFENYKDCLFYNRSILKSQQRHKRDNHKVHTEQINKIALSSNDNERLQTFDKITTYPHGTNAFKVCQGEMLMVMKYKDLVLNDKNHIKETNKIFKKSVTKCMLNRSIRFRKGAMFIVTKYKYFLLDNIDHIKETSKTFNAISAKCIVKRSINFRETVLKKSQTPSKI